jgi:hypothetical protein
MVRKDRIIQRNTPEGGSMTQLRDALTDLFEANPRLKQQASWALLPHYEWLEMTPWIKANKYLGFDVKLDPSYTFSDDPTSEHYLSTADLVKNWERMVSWHGSRSGFSKDINGRCQLVVDRIRKYWNQWSIKQGNDSQLFDETPLQWPPIKLTC